jgi:hypothetical protein
VSPGSNAGMSVRKPSRANSANRSMVGSSLVRLVQEKLQRS